MLSEDQLCRIQAEGGAGLLSHTCATYPRIVRTVEGAEEKALTLSCPEAARQVLLGPMTFSSSQPTAVNPSRSFADLTGRPIQSWFLPIRSAALELVRNRAYPLWQRLFLLGIFCRRLDTIASGELRRTVPAFIREFEATVARGSLRAAMNTLPTDDLAQMDVVLRLAGMMLYRSNVTARFADCIHFFTAGIGNCPDATLESLTAQYSLAHERYFRPFFARHPAILENYMMNTIVRCQFPFGSKAMNEGTPPVMMREFATLTAQFALMKGLLTGVAGFHRDSFSTAHVVHTVQASTKHFEHHPEFLNYAYSLLVESRMDGVRGLGILLRNSEPAVRKPAAPVYAPGPMTGTTGL
jgi:lysine-N-methylase